MLMQVLPGGRYALRNLRLPGCAVAVSGLPRAGDGLVAADVTVEAGRIAWIGPPSAEVDLPAGPDMAGAMLWPCPVDCHVHLDKGQAWARSANPDGSFASALYAAAADRVHHDEADIRRRAEFQLEAAFAHGTQALRSHVDGRVDGFDRAFAVLAELVEDWRDRMAVQIAPFTGPEEPEDWVAELARIVARQAPGVLSAALYATPELDAFLDRVLALADRHGLMLDFHADETLDPASHCLRAVAVAVLRNRHSGPVLVGHCCALAVQPEDEMERTLDLVARAGLGVVALPLCNTYLMDRRPGGSPRLRGFAPVHEMRARGIPVALASDNARDAFHAYGDLDAVELFRDALRIMQLDQPVGDWPAAVTVTPARLIGLPDLRLRPGGPADLVLLAARNWSEFAARPQASRIVLRGGRPVDTAPPDFRTLDDLNGMHP